VTPWVEDLPLLRVLCVAPDACKTSRDPVLRSPSKYLAAAGYLRGHAREAARLFFSCFALDFRAGFCYFETGFLSSGNQCPEHKGMFFRRAAGKEEKERTHWGRLILQVRS